MSLYNAIFGTNPIAPLLLAILDKTPEDFGRFRDIYLDRIGGKLAIAVYTRNGGGNRDCWCEGNPKYGTSRCQHRVIQEEVDETVTLTEEEITEKGYTPINVFIGNKRMAKTGKRVMQDYYVCESPNSPKCHCVGCFMSYHVHKLPGYICDRDDDYDCTYATIFLEVPDKWKALLGELVDNTENPSPADRWDAFFQKLSSAHADDPDMRRAMEALAPVLGFTKENPDA